MSYILDAIRKAEDERQSNHSAVSVYSVQSARHSAVEHMPTSANRLWLGVGLGFALSVSALILKPELILMQSAELGAEVDIAAPLAAAPNHQLTKLPSTESESSSTLASTEQVNTAPKEPAKALMVPLWKASAAAQTAVSQLQFSFHVFSKKPSSRTIIINGQRMREGQRISAELELASITANGVVLQHSTGLVSVDILEQW